ncbi:AraC family transcriptional regulator [Shewanella gelidimarina]|uniref:AraC family transcriptional regulator n=1 Tax=Shewanella gelidimarina TaxID=56813 RepID=UPI00200D0804|nr:AraC family transcriptional regulator [Shewanella gelidimarina]MCL1056698.1 AraC family transcriptional regulator [Shewanella gelidimarina]
MNQQTSQHYSAKIVAICDYIALHLDDNLNVQQLSQVVHFSKYHFHRQFQVFTGINVGRYILMMRLKRASYRLVFHANERITDIALDAGFENSESFSRAFKKAFIQTPSQFRLTPNWQLWSDEYEKVNLTRNDTVNIELTHRDETPVAVLEHHGAPQTLNDSLQKFIEWRKATTDSPVASSQSIGVPYNDPNTVPAEQFHFDICGSLTQELQANDYGVIAKMIPGGRFAKIRHLGSHQQMDEKIYQFYRDWLPASGEQLRDFPLFFQYMNLFPAVPENELITDIYFALK